MFIAPSSRVQHERARRRYLITSQVWMLAMFDATDAIRSMRNTRLERGAQGETGLGRAAVTVCLRQALFSACFQVRSGMHVCRRYTARSTSAAWISWPTWDATSSVASP